MGYQVANSIWPCGHQHPELAGPGGRRLSQTKPTPAPGVCCQLTEDGQSVICSDGIGYNIACPKCPGPNMPGTAKYSQQGSMLVPIPPSPGDCGDGGAVVGGSSFLGSLLPVAVLAGVGYIGYTLLK